jgi:predicted nucleic acid-binding protein
LSEVPPTPPRIVLDSWPLSLVCHPNEAQPHVKEARLWLARHLAAGRVVYVAEIADYEVRRELIRLGKSRSVRRLDALRDTLNYIALDTPTMRRAADLWALARARGRPSADPKEIDADVILAAQAEKEGATVATQNVAHFEGLVTVADWLTL